MFKIIDSEKVEQMIFKVKTRSINLYEYRQKLELQRQQLQLEINKVEQEFIKLDGELSSLEELLKDG